MAQTQIKSSNAHNYTFGIEIETLIPTYLVTSGRVRIGAYRHGIQVPELPLGWTAEKDCSVTTQRAGYTPCEIVSPILKGYRGILAVTEVANWLVSVNAQTNRTCGTHIHVGIESFAGTNGAKQAKTVANLINLTAQYEWALRGAAGSRFRVHNVYCKSIVENGAYRESSKAIHEAKHNKKVLLDLTVQCNLDDRYHVLNLTNLNNSKKTVEFRAFTGTTSALKMTSWIQMCLAMCEKATGRKVKYDAGSNNCYLGGQAESQLNRFFYIMGWTLGRKDVKKAEVTMSGWILTAHIELTKKELRRLAKKFDSQG
jgi:hypothetical protein